MFVVLWSIFMMINPSIYALDYSPLETLIVTSDAFENNGAIPLEYSGKGIDISPQLNVSNISDKGKSIVIIMDDLDVPLKGIYNHWVIWNIPIQNIIPKNIPYGSPVESLGNAIQGVGYGKNRYKGPNPPFGTHRYKFNVFILDSMLELDSKTRKKELLKAIENHVIQYGYIIGTFSK